MILLHPSRSHLHTTIIDTEFVWEERLYIIGILNTYRSGQEEGIHDFHTVIPKYVLNIP